MPSTTPDSPTIALTSSVMSVTWRPPLVRNFRSLWKTFTGASLDNSGHRSPAPIAFGSGAARPGAFRSVDRLGLCRDADHLPLRVGEEPEHDARHGCRRLDDAAAELLGRGECGG